MKTRDQEDELTGRDRKKIKQRREMLHAAAKLFKRAGYQETRMEDIAAEAGFSTKTIYNYFETKDKILVGLLRDDRRDLKAGYESAAATLGDDPTEALARLMMADIGDVTTGTAKLLWRELIAAELRTDHHTGDDFELNRREFTNYIAMVLRHFVESGALSEPFDITQATEVIYAIHHSAFAWYCCDAQMTPEDFYASVHGRILFVLDGYRAKRGPKTSPAGPRRSSRPSPETQPVRPPQGRGAEEHS